MAGQPDFQLRAFCHLDRIQPQFAAFVGAIASGAPPVEGMSSLYVEMAPGNWVFRVMDKVLKAVDVQPGAQVVERQFGMFEVHSMSQADVLRAGDVVLEFLDRPRDSRIAPKIASEQITFDIELSFEARWPWSSSHAVCRIDSRAVWMSMWLSASMNDTPSCDPSGLPNAVRRRA